MTAEKKVPRVFSSFRLPVETRAEIARLAGELNISQADVVVRAIDREVNPLIKVDAESLKRFPAKDDTIAVATVAVGSPVRAADLKRPPAHTKPLPQNLPAKVARAPVLRPSGRI
jgi:hypothetical protein